MSPHKTQRVHQKHLVMLGRVLQSLPEVQLQEVLQSLPEVQLQEVLQELAPAEREEQVASRCHVVLSVS